MNEVEFHEWSPHVVRIDAGATWKHVLDVVDPKKYTVIHGNVSRGSILKVICNTKYIPDQAQCSG